MTIKYENFNGFELINCLVRTKNIIGFTAQQWKNNDPLEQKTTAVFFYYPDETKNNRWAVRYLGEATGIHGTATFLPNERWVFLTDDGEVYCVGEGDDDWEKPVSKKDNLYFSNIKSIRGGHAVCVGPRRKVYLRKCANNWVQISNGLFSGGDKINLDNSGFKDIDGFSESDMYACGGSELWQFDGNIWKKIDIPTNSVLSNICCSDDGFVYITTNRRDIIIGRNDAWSIINQDLTNEVFESIVCFNGKTLVSTVSDIYEVSNKGIQKTSLNIPKIKSKAHLSVGDGVLVIAGRNEAVIYDGNLWVEIS